MHHESKITKECLIFVGGLCLSSIAFVFAIEGNLNIAFLDVGPSSDWGVSDPNKNDRIRGEYDDYVSLFYECIFLILGLQLPFNDFEKEVLKHLVVALS